MIINQVFIRDLQAHLQSSSIAVLQQQYDLRVTVHQSELLEPRFLLPKQSITSVLKIESVEHLWLVQSLDFSLQHHLFEKATSGWQMHAEEETPLKNDFAAEFHNTVVGASISGLQYRPLGMGAPKIRSIQEPIERFSLVHVLLSSFKTMHGHLYQHIIVPARYYNQNLEKREVAHYV